QATFSPSTALSLRTPAVGSYVPPVLWISQCGMVLVHPPLASVTSSKLAFRILIGISTVSAKLAIVPHRVRNNRTHKARPTIFMNGRSYLFNSDVSRARLLPNAG